MDAIEVIKEHMRVQREKHELWAFLDRHGGSGSRYSSGYLVALEELEEVLKRVEREQSPQQLALF